PSVGFSEWRPANPDSERCYGERGSHGAGRPEKASLVRRGGPRPAGGTPEIIGCYNHDARSAYDSAVEWGLLHAIAVNIALPDRQVSDVLEDLQPRDGSPYHGLPNQPMASALERETPCRYSAPRCP